MDSHHKSPAMQKAFPCHGTVRGPTVGVNRSVCIVGTLGCVFIDNETHETDVTKCTTGEAWSAFS